LLVERAKVDEGVHEELNGEDDEDVVDVETRVTVVEGEEAVHRELGAEVVVLAGEHLLTHTGRDLGREIEDSTETEITTLSALREGRKVRSVSLSENDGERERRRTW
jgi:hypothetical protein